MINKRLRLDKQAKKSYNILMENPTFTVELLKENAALKAENAELKRELQWIKDQLILKESSFALPVRKANMT